MTTVFFLGNPAAGDDAIGAHLYQRLKNLPELSGMRLEKVDSGIEIADTNDVDVIVVDAVKSDREEGKVVLVDKKQLAHLEAVSAHDFGAGQGIKLLRSINPHVRLTIIGISAKNPGSRLRMSKDIARKMPRIEKEVTKRIIESACVTQYQER